VNRTVASATSFAGDVLAEFVYPGNVMGYTGPSFHSAEKTTATASILDATQREGMITEGSGGGNTYVLPYKSATAVPPAINRSGNLYIELVGTAFKISTGATYAARAAIYTGLRVDAAARFFAMTDHTNSTALNKSVRIRVRAHPGG